MANTTTDFIIIGAVILLFVAVIALGMLQKGQRKKRIQAFKRQPVIESGKPILVQGHAGGTAYALPSTGEKVAYYSISVTSRQVTTTRTWTNTGVEGFGAFAQTGDFSITTAGKTYAIRIASAFDKFAPGIAMTKNAITAMAGPRGVNDAFLRNAMELKTSESVLGLIFGFINPYSDAGKQQRTSTPFQSRETSTMDATPIFGQKDATSYVSTRLSRYTVGRDLPDSVTALLKAKGIDARLSKEGQEVLLVENYVPYGQPVFAFGTYDGNGGITFADTTTGLTISYADPETL